MAQAIVDAFEAVQVDIDKGQAFVVLLAGPEDIRQALGKGAAVDQPCLQVMGGLEGDLGFLFLAVGDIPANAPDTDNSVIDYYREVGHFQVNKTAFGCPATGFVGDGIAGAGGIKGGLCLFLVVGVNQLIEMSAKQFIFSVPGNALKGAVATLEAPRQIQLVNAVLVVVEQRAVPFVQCAVFLAQDLSQWRVSGDFLVNALLCGKNGQFGIHPGESFRAGMGL